MRHYMAGEKIDVTPYDGDVLINFLNLKVMSLVTQGWM